MIENRNTPTQSIRTHHFNLNQYVLIHSLLDLENRKNKVNVLLNFKTNE